MEKIIIGNIDWLRNDYKQDIRIGGIIYPSLEHAYQAAKTKDRSIKQQIADTDSVREARKIGRGLKQSDSFNRDQVMEALLRSKFSSETGNFGGEKLAKTGSAPIVMEGYDDYWGTGESGNGDNVLGEMLQTIRSELQIIYDIDLDECDGDCDGDCDDCHCHCHEDVPTLKEALINNPDEALAKTCQELFDGAKTIVSLLDANDFNATYISQKTGAPLAQIENAIKQVQAFQATLTALEDLLETPSNLGSPDDDESEDDESEDD
ncbi:NADAR family protein, partial [Candidatus Pacearchaeota archaeon]|nr:NADAR family protein [Candidatus Pacearchaeota archaeon]